MKKVDSEGLDELRPEYKRTDFGKMVRGKYASQLSEETNAKEMDISHYRKSCGVKSHPIDPESLPEYFR
uniref:Uncharacterized protein n=1 Tax=Candidatus Kentrum sp. FM TaxID=2126340 RepID=A0A450TW41_9GAMM|nr:MAG: hypothetical protein BECKFM1743A_GA0114220_106123 [Candidatus Kentron sp. FM]VFJ73222.1 MAG: hypothetical protein BECKFM1743C_GA0114222_107122 [Candidatus Kentron sp. FM]VFK20346.1 MAG: hypothetical protein BECKFM1743B_GA0114221_106882 [Candidatus Kentron sp. FM]